MRLAPLWERALNDFCGAEDVTPSLHMLQICSQLASYVFARQLSPEEYDGLAELVGNLIYLMQHSLREKHGGRPKAHQLHHLLQCYQLWTGA
jgi:hypothetical protein